MALFNLKKNKSKKTVNRAGGQAYTQSAKMELVSILLTSFAQDQYYRSTNESDRRIKMICVRYVSNS